MRETMEDLGGAAKYTFHTAEEAAERFLCRGEKPIGAISYEAGSLSAYRFVVGLLKMCLQRGMGLHTKTPVRRLRKDDDGRDHSWIVETERGVIRTRRIVLATNGYTGYLYEGLKRVVVPIRGQITAQRPGRGMPKGGLQTTYSFIYKDGYEYMISRPRGSKFEGDIIMGGGLVKAQNEGLEEYGTTDDTALNPEISGYLKEATPRYFGDSWGQDHEEGRVRKEWSGIMGYSADGFPFVGEVPRERGLWITASFQGHGMVLCFLCARALVVMMGSQEGEDRGLEKWFPAAFRLTEERMGRRFRGRLHTKPSEVEVEAGFQA
jgi:glycine/D-amino acid oxidase-like deaminating enzyme